VGVRSADALPTEANGSIPAPGLGGCSQVDVLVRHRIQTYLEGVHPIKELTKFFRSTYEVEGIPNAGCLLTNTAAEIGADDPEIQCKVEEGFSILREAFALQVRRAQSQGLAPLDLAAETAAAN
jgi:hypothetical protein